MWQVSNLEAGRGLPRQATLDLLLRALTGALALDVAEQWDLRTAFREAVRAGRAPPPSAPMPPVPPEAPQPPQVPVGILTFLVCAPVRDAPGQSARQQMLQASSPHPASLLHRVLPRHGGRLMDPPDSPDGAVCVFSQADDAVQAACVLQQALWGWVTGLQPAGRRRPPFPAAHGPLLPWVRPPGEGRHLSVNGSDARIPLRLADPARAVDSSEQRLVEGLAAPVVNPVPVGAAPVSLALHSGWAELGVGDYAGPTRWQATRLARLGHGGQLLLTSATRELLGRSLPEGIRLQDVCRHTLNVVERPRTLYQLVPSRSPAAFPPPRALPTPATNLPMQLTSFIGREREQAPLVALVGAGGSGKTRLALAVAAALLRRCPHLQVLATSRERLGIGGERIYQVPSLPLPTPDQPPPRQR